MNAQQTTTTQQDRFTWLKELNFISVFFSWFFMLLSRLAEPCMSLAALYIIIEAGIPAVASSLFTNLSEGVLIAAPEIILPGAFVIAAQAKSQGNTKAWMLYSMCWLFVLLTGVTLASLFVIHLTGTALSILMCARCTAGVGYSILIRVVTHSTEQQVPEQKATIVLPQFDHVALIDQVNNLVASMALLEKSVSQSPDIEACIQSLKAEFNATLKTMKWDMSHWKAPQESATFPDVALPLARAVEEAGTSIEQEEESDTEQQESATKAPLTTQDIQQYHLSHPGVTQQEIADFFGVARRTIQRKMGQEKPVNGTHAPLRILK